LVRYINGGGGVVTKKHKLQFQLNNLIEVSGWNRVWIEKELVFDLSALAQLENLKILSAKLSVSSTVNVFGKFMIFFNGVSIYETTLPGGESSIQNYEINTDIIVLGQNYVRVEHECYLAWITLRVYSVILTLEIETTSSDTKVEETVNTVVNDTRNTIKANITPDVPINPQNGGNVWGTVTKVFEMLPFLLIIIIIAETIRAFRR
jgi:hypothetical protein